MKIIGPRWVRRTTGTIVKFERTMVHDYLLELLQLDAWSSLQMDLRRRRGVLRGFNWDLWDQMKTRK